ncbi:MAG: DNA polymerase I, partial [Clostridia bacterium]|nr:DNA polymerase I [Clostridia bacterium]
MKNLLIIDGNSIINRAFYGIRLLTNKHGLFTNAIYGFLKIMFKHIDELSPDYICVAFDLKAPTFRHKMYHDYKAQRKGMPDELRMQMPVMKEVLGAMNIAILEKEGFEADDIIGTVSRMCDEGGISCHILTGDRDDLQLASANTDVLLTITRMGATTTTVYDADAVYEEYGVTPSEFVDVKALMGDSSDNVPGVKGIGEKTAFGYIQKFKSIEKLYDNLDDEIIKPAARKKLQDGKDMAALSKKLCTIDRHVPIDSTLDDYERKEYNIPRLTELFVNLEFNAFLKSIAPAPKDVQNEDVQFEKIDAAKLKGLMSDFSGELVYKLYGTKSIDGFAFKNGKSIYFCPAATPDDSAAIADAIRLVFENRDILKISDDIKSSIIALHAHGVTFDDAYFDTGIAAYIINPAKSSYTTASVAVDLLS